MTTYISILRGINVGGQKIIKLDALRKMYENLGFKSVKTYFQSGNVIFKSKDFKISVLEQNISRQIKKDFGFDVPVIALTIDKLKKIIDDNPLSKDIRKDASFLLVTFLSSKPKSFEREVIESKRSAKEEISFSEDAVYLYCPDGYGISKLSNSFLETRLKVGATTRNWRTTNELLKIAQEIT